MPQANLLDRFDLDLTLRDAALDDALRPGQRMLANATLGMDVLDAYYSVRELREAAAWVHEGLPAGKRKLIAILGNDGADDYQRCLYYALAGRGVVAMLDDLQWLEDLLEARARVAAELHRTRVRIAPLDNPYIADEPDGPVGRFSGDFAQGASWWQEALPR